MIPFRQFGSIAGGCRAHRPWLRAARAGQADDAGRPGSVPSLPLGSTGSFRTLAARSELPCSLR